MSNEVFRFGAERVRTTAGIKRGLSYQDERDRVAKAHDCFDGIVILDWQDSGKQSQCSIRQFLKRFSYHGNGHSV